MAPRNSIVSRIIPGHIPFRLFNACTYMPGKLHELLVKDDTTYLIVRTGSYIVSLFFLEPACTAGGGKLITIVYRNTRIYTWYYLTLVQIVYAW